MIFENMRKPSFPGTLTATSRRTGAKLSRKGLTATSLYIPSFQHSPPTKSLASSLIASFLCSSDHAFCPSALLFSPF